MSIRDYSTKAIVTALLLATSTAGQPSDDWSYYGLPNGPSAAGVHAVRGHHHQPIPIYSPSQSAVMSGPRNPIRFGWFGRFSPSPRPRPTSVGVR